MLEEKIQKKIESRFQVLEESLKHSLETQIEILSNLETIRYLLFLTSNNQKKLP